MGAEKRAEAANRKAEWEARQAKRAEWEARKVERDAKHAAREAKCAEWEGRRAKAQPNSFEIGKKDWDMESNATEASTAATFAAISTDDAEVERMAMMDKTVRKFSKLLRDIARLEGITNLDALQQ